MGSESVNQNSFFSLPIFSKINIFLGNFLTLLLGSIAKPAVAAKPSAGTSNALAFMRQLEETMAARREKEKQSHLPPIQEHEFNSRVNFRQTKEPLSITDKRSAPSEGGLRDSIVSEPPSSAVQALPSPPITPYFFQFPDNKNQAQKANENNNGIALVKAKSHIPRHIHAPTVRSEQTFQVTRQESLID